MNRDSIIRSAFGDIRPYAEPWYLAYLILGLINSGLLPFLLPLAVASAARNLDSVAYVIGAYNLGLLPAPLFGVLAERRRPFRPVFFGGFVVLTLGLGAITAVSDLSAWVALTVLCGVGVGAVATIAPLFVVDFTPKPEWNPRIGWLQGFNGAGQLVGLLLAALVARGPLAYGFWLAAVLSALGSAKRGNIGLQHRENTATASRTIYFVIAIPRRSPGVRPTRVKLFRRRAGRRGPFRGCPRGCIAARSACRL